MRVNNGEVVALVGAQYGSEGKGVIAAHLADEFDIHVRTGGPNAGHSFQRDGQVWKMQSIPCGWINPEALIVIGAGALVNPSILMREIKQIEAIEPDFRARLLIDAHAGVLDEHHHQEEGGVEGEMHQRIGSTGEGIGAARRDRMMRDPSKFRRMIDIAPSLGLMECMSDTVEVLHDAMPYSSILLEGTQGSALSLIHGPWPYVTSHDTNAAQLAADAGVSPRKISRVILVARSYPIRVAGNSGPLKGETTWDEMSNMLGERVEERTTVTHKIRRIGEWDDGLFRRALMLNCPTSIAVTFADYIDPAVAGERDYNRLTPRVRLFLERVADFGVPVSMVGTGGEGWQVTNTGQPL